MADMFAPLVAQLKANPKTIVFTEGNDPRILEAASKLLAEGVLKVVMVGNEAECKAAAAAGNFDISAAEIIDPENYAGSRSAAGQDQEGRSSGELLLHSGP